MPCIVKVCLLRTGRFHDIIGALPLRERYIMKSLRDPRTGRVFGFQSERQRENFMIGRARICDGPNREMPRCTALNQAWASPVGQPGCAAGQPASATAEALRPNGRGWRPHTCLETWTASSAPRCDQNVTDCARSGAAIRASPARRFPWFPSMRRPAEHGQRGKVSRSMYSTATFRHSRMHAGGYGRACRAV